MSTASSAATALASTMLRENAPHPISGSIAEIGAQDAVKSARSKNQTVKKHRFNTVFLFRQRKVHRVFFMEISDENDIIGTLEERILCT